jgi:hypothetical protein
MYTAVVPSRLTERSSTLNWTRCYEDGTWEGFDHTIHLRAAISPAMPPLLQQLVRRTR